MSHMVNKEISAETVVDGRFDRSLILMPIKSIFHVSKTETKVMIYEDHKDGRRNPFLGDATFYMS